MSLSPDPDITASRVDFDIDVNLPSSVLNCNYSPSSADCVDEDDLASMSAPFCFETDHEALRGNDDYAALLRTMAVLHAQKLQAVADVERLVEARDEANRNPIDLVKRLQKGEKLDLPEKQRIAEMPDIEWEKYRVVAADDMEDDDGGGRGSAVGKDDFTLSSSSASSATTTTFVGGQFFVRGRAFDEKKPVTFNQPWTPEEQRRLEELLVQFPSEDVEMERWKKIATALGNRTAVQVQSRTQKYFQKLSKAGLPIPGRLNKNRSRYMRQTSSGRTSNHASKRYAGSLVGHKNSSFFPSLSPSVKMEEDDEDEDESMALSGAKSGPILNDGYYLEDEDVSDEEEVPENMRRSEAYRELMWLKRIRREKELEQRTGGPSVHAGFRCDGCDTEPIVGGRFQCSECLDPDTVDFCCTCAARGLDVGDRHKAEHVLKPVRKKKAAATAVDREYLDAKNYLDPNFVKS